MKLDKSRLVPAVEATKPVGELHRHESRSVYDLLDAPRDKVQISSVAEALKIGQEALQTKLGQSIHAKFKSVGVDLEEHLGVDYSPEAVSDRIAHFAASMFGRFQLSRPELGDEEAAARYESLFRGGVETGYAEAMELLEGMHMPEAVLAVSRETKELIDEKLDAFFVGLGQSEADEDRRSA